MTCPGQGVSVSVASALTLIFFRGQSRRFVYAVSRRAARRGGRREASNPRESERLCSARLDSTRFDSLEVLVRAHALPSQDAECKIEPIWQLTEFGAACPACVFSFSFFFVSILPCLPYSCRLLSLFLCFPLLRNCQSKPQPAARSIDCSLGRGNFLMEDFVSHRFLPSSIRSCL